MGIFKDLKKDLMWICYWIYSVDNPLKTLPPVNQNLRCYPVYLPKTLKLQRMCSIGGYAHEKVLSTRYSGCSVLASAVALLAIVVVVLSSVVILLATVVTNTLSDLVLRGFRACWDLLWISI